MKIIKFYKSSLKHLIKLYDCYGITRTEPNSVWNPLNMSIDSLGKQLDKEIKRLNKSK